MTEKEGGPQIIGVGTVVSKILPKNITFLSYGDDQGKTSKLVEGIIRSFLQNLGFTVWTFRDARSSSPFISEIDRLIRESFSLIAFLTKDIAEEGTEKWHPKGNIPEEIGRALALGHTVILYHEEGVTIPSNPKSYYCRPFVNDKSRHVELLIDLAKALKINNLL